MSHRKGFLPFLLYQSILRGVLSRRNLGLPWCFWNAIYCTYFISVPVLSKAGIGGTMPVWDAISWGFPVAFIVILNRDTGNKSTLCLQYPWNPVCSNVSQQKLMARNKNKNQPTKKLWIFEGLQRKKLGSSQLLFLLDHFAFLNGKMDEFLAWHRCK